jgi:hypothetical protein
MSESKKLAEKTYYRPSFDDRMNEGGLLFWAIALGSGLGLALILIAGLSLDLLLN